MLGLLVQVVILWQSAKHVFVVAENAGKFSRKETKFCIYQFGRQASRTNLLLAIVVIVVALSYDPEIKIVPGSAIHVQ